MYSTIPPQIETLLAGGVRYVLRRNPVRAAEIAATRAGKQASLTALATPCSMEVQVEGGASCLRIPTPRDASRALRGAPRPPLIPQSLCGTNRSIHERMLLGPAGRGYREKT